jgi:hypothetical protein
MKGIAATIKRQIETHPRLPQTADSRMGDRPAADYGSALARCHWDATVTMLTTG